VRRALEVARVPLIGINVHFEHDLGVIANADALEDDATRAVDLQLHLIAVAHAVVVHVVGGHVHVPLGPDHAAVERERALRAHDRDAGRVLVVAADAQRQVDAEVDAVGVAQLHLRVVPDRPKDADVRDDALPRPDEGHELLGRELTLLVEVLHLREFRALAEEDLQVLRRHVHVPRGDVDHQRIGRPARRQAHGGVPLARGRRGGAAKLLLEHFADELFDFSAVQGPGGFANHLLQAFLAEVSITVQYIPEVVKSFGRI
jgi:hypothetical protein